MRAWGFSLIGEGRWFVARRDLVLKCRGGIVADAGGRRWVQREGGPRQTSREGTRVAARRGAISERKATINPTPHQQRHPTDREDRHVQLGVKLAIGIIVRRMLARRQAAVTRDGGILVGMLQVVQGFDGPGAQGEEPERQED